MQFAINDKVVHSGMRRQITGTSRGSTDEASSFCHLYPRSG